MNLVLKDTSNVQTENRCLREELRKAHLKNDQLEIDLWSLEHGFQKGSYTQEKKIFNANLTITKMIWACHLGDYPMCKLLLKHGSDTQLSEPASNKSSPLAFACEKGNLEIAQWLVKNSKHSDVNKVDDHGRTPLFHTICNGKLETAKWLLSVGASLKIVDIYHLNLLHVVCKSSLSSNNKSFELFIWLYNYGFKDIRGKTKSGNTPMFFACMKGNLKICKWLFQHGAHDDIRTPNDNEITPLCISCAEEQYQIVKWLLTTPAVEDFYDHENKRLLLFNNDINKGIIKMDIILLFINQGLLNNIKESNIHLTVLNEFSELDYKSIKMILEKIKLKVMENYIFRSTFLLGVTQNLPSLGLLNLGTETKSLLMTLILEFSDIPFGKALINCKETYAIIKIFYRCRFHK